MADLKAFDELSYHWDEVGNFYFCEHALTEFPELARAWQDYKCAIRQINIELKLIKDTLDV